MKLKVQVLTDVKENDNGKPYQVLGVTYPGSMLPVEVSLYLGKRPGYPKGDYEVDLTKAMVADPRNFNNPRINWFEMESARPGTSKAA